VVEHAFDGQSRMVDTFIVSIQPHVFTVIAFYYFFYFGRLYTLPFGKAQRTPYPTPEIAVRHFDLMSMATHDIQHTMVIPITVAFTQQRETCRLEHRFDIIERYFLAHI
jgi:hypothetical protein